MNLQMQLSRQHSLMRKNLEMKAEKRGDITRSDKGERVTSNYGISRMFGIKYVPAGSAKSSAGVSDKAPAKEVVGASNEPLLAGDLGEMRTSYFTDVDDGQNPFKKRRGSVFGNGDGSLFGN